jgi:hypothetical protein
MGPLDLQDGVLGQLLSHIADTIHVHSKFSSFSSVLNGFMNLMDVLSCVQRTGDGHHIEEVLHFIKIFKILPKVNSSILVSDFALIHWH